MTTSTCKQYHDDLEMKNMMGMVTDQYWRSTVTSTTSRCKIHLDDLGPMAGQFIRMEIMNMKNMMKNTFLTLDQYQIAARSTNERACDHKRSKEPCSCL